jgi:hypothetical protein
MTDSRTNLAASRPSPWKWLVLLLLATVAVRLCVILMPPTALFEKGAVPHEEILRGNATKDLMEGPVAPIEDYQVNHFWGGSLLMSFLAIPCFWLLGPTVVAMRLPSILFAVGAVVFAFLLLDRFASRRVAWYGAILMAFAPPGYAIVGSTVYGTHLESNTLALMLAWLYLEYVAHDRRGPWRALSFGLACGFGLWFGYGLLLVLVTLLLLEFLNDKLFFARRWFWLIALGFLAGFSPWIRYRLDHPGRGFDVYDISIAQHFVVQLQRGTAPTKCLEFFTIDWPMSHWFQDALYVDGLFLGRVLVLASLALAAVALWAWRASIASAGRALFSAARRQVEPTPLLFAAIFVALFFPAYIFSDFTIGGRDMALNFRYLMPLWPFTVVMMALGLDVLASRGPNGPLTARVVIVAFALLGAGGTLASCQPSKARANWSTPGYSFEYFVRFVIQRFGTDAEMMKPVIARIDATRSDAEAERLYRAIAKGLRILSRDYPNQSSDDEGLHRMHRNMLQVLSETGAIRWRPIFEEALKQAREDQLTPPGK